MTRFHLFSETTRPSMLVNRRALVAALAAAGLLARWGVAMGQQALPRVWRLGFLTASSRQTLIDRGAYGALVRGLAELGYVEGKNLVIEGRFADDDYDRLPAYAAELVTLGVDVIIAVPSAAIRAARDATNTIPIVFPTTGDPVGSGFAKTLARPGRNLTGLSNNSLDISAKTLELLKTLAPTVSRVAILDNPGSSTQAAMARRIKAAAAQLGIGAVELEARTPNEIELAFVAMRREHADAVVISGDAFLNDRSPQIAQLAIDARLPSITQTLRYASVGGLMGYGPDVNESYRRAATYVDKILKGAKPGDLPIEQPTKFALALNLATARKLGLTVPPSIVLLADTVIS